MTSCPMFCLSYVFFPYSRLSVTLASLNLCLKPATGIQESAIKDHRVSKHVDHIYIDAC